MNGNCSKYLPLLPVKICLIANSQGLLVRLLMYLFVMKKMMVYNIPLLLTPIPQMLSFITRSAYLGLVVTQCVCLNWMCVRIYLKSKVST